MDKHLDKASHFGKDRVGYFRKIFFNIQVVKFKSQAF